MVNITLEFSLSELNELHYATSKHMDAMEERSHSIPCSYSDLMLRKAIEIHRKVSLALMDEATK